MRRTRWVEGAEVGDQPRAVSDAQGHEVRGRIEPEIGEARPLIIARIKRPRWRRDVHEPQSGLEMRRQLARQFIRRWMQCPRSRLLPAELNPIVSRLDLDPADMQRLGSNDAVGLEMLKIP